MEQFTASADLTLIFFDYSGDDDHLFLATYVKKMEKTEWDRLFFFPSCCRKSMNDVNNSFS